MNDITHRTVGYRFSIPVSLLAFVIQAPALADVDNAKLADEKNGIDWPAYGRTFSEQRFSPLDQINRETVPKLGLAWTLELPDVWNVSSAPVEVDGVIYIAVGFSVIYAVQATSGKLLWHYDPKVTSEKMRFAWGIRGLSFWQGKVIAGVQDGRLFALDAKSGKLIWETLTTQPGDNRYITGAPRVFNGKVIIGHGGADFGHVRGYVSTYDAETGALLWRWYIVPGDPAKGFENKAMEMAAKTWKGQWWKFGGGGTAWNAMTYDPDYNRVYIGTGNGGPWNAKLRSPGGGDNLFLCSIVALNADTGEYVWHYQTAPGESWDFTSTMDIVLSELVIDGKPRKVILHADRNGYFYVLDGSNGHLLRAKPFVRTNWNSGFDSKGRPTVNPATVATRDGVVVFPAVGGTNFQAPSYDAKNGLFILEYVSSQGFAQSAPVTYEKGKQFLGRGVGSGPVSAESDQGIEAIDAKTGNIVWKFPMARVGLSSGLIGTAGSFVFAASAEGQLLALDEKTGKPLWHLRVNGPVNSSPMAYMAGGKEFIAVTAATHVLTFGLPD